MAKRGRKKGAITIEEKRTQRRKDHQAAERAAELNEGKVPVRLNKRTTVYVHPDDVKFYETEARKRDYYDRSNKERREFLQKIGWRVNMDYSWSPRGRNEKYSLLEALDKSGYYEHYRSPTVIEKMKNKKAS